MIQQPYYNLHQITVGLYTEGGEFVFDDGTDYIGLYHELPNQSKFSGARPENGSRILFPKQVNLTNDLLMYNNIKNFKVSQYVSPVLQTLPPTMDDYKVGKFTRFFVQKRNSPFNSIIEIDSQQYNSVNKKNRPGINGVIWSKLSIEWRISKIPIQDIEYYNRTTLIRAENDFPYIGSYLTNSTEYYRQR